MMRTIHCPACGDGDHVSIATDSGATRLHWVGTCTSCGYTWLFHD